MKILPLYKNLTDFSKKSSVSLSLNNYRTIKLNTIKMHRDYSPIGIQKLKLRIEENILISIKRIYISKITQKIYLRFYRIIILLKGLIFTRKIKLYHFSDEIVSLKAEVGSFNYGLKKLSIAEYVDKFDELKLEKKTHTITVYVKFWLLSNFFRGKSCSFFHDLQQLILWRTYNNVKYEKFVVVEGNDFVTKVVMDILQYYGSQIEILHKTTYLGCPNPNKYLNLVTTPEEYAAQRLIGNKVDFCDYNNQLTIPPYPNHGLHVVFFTTAPHVVFPENDIINDTKTVIQVCKEINIPLKISLHPQLRKKVNLISTLGSCELRDPDQPLDECVKEALVVISHWSTVVRQSIACNKRVILLDYNNNGLVEAFTSEEQKSLSVAKCERDLLETLKSIVEQSRM